MKQSLQLRLGQHLTMTPQLQQAIRLLQLSTLELRMEVQQALESNLMLEVQEGDLDDDEEELSPEEEELAQQAEEAQAALEEDEPEAGPAADEIPDELPVDSAWEDVYDNISTGASTYEADEREIDYGDRSSESLHEHLAWQLRMTTLGPTDIAIAEAIIDSIDEDGYLITPLEELQQGMDPELEVELDEMEAVLHCIQNFDPPGVGARDLREALLLQLRQLEAGRPLLAEARALVEEHFDLLANRDFAKLKRKMRLDDEGLADVVRLIQSLNPRPGGHISDRRPEYVVPDVIISKVKGAWRVELNPEAAPRLRINPAYARLAKQVADPNDSTYLKNHLQEARWFIKSLASRNETLLKVASCIVEHQRDFLEQGEVAMKPLVLHDVAREVDMHESTISRVTTRKYMLTPRGVFELKYFFSSHVSTASGGEASSTAIRALIKKMIAEENPSKPLSDSKIAGALVDEGINVARRTVAKYREAMAIPPSNERKRLA